MVPAQDPAHSACTVAARFTENLRLVSFSTIQDRRFPHHMLAINLRRGSHTRCYSVRSSTSDGWEVSLEEDCAVSRRVRYRDWHRVERAMALLEREIADLATQGWEVQSGR
jgi:hypothetical protein